MRLRDIRRIEEAAVTCRNESFLEPGKHRLVSIIVTRQNKMASLGKNSFDKTHPLQAKYAKKTKNRHRIYLHAEISAIIAAKNADITGGTIYVVRVNRKGDLALAKPCVVCNEAIRQAGIRRVVYSTNKGVEEYEL